ncbi:MAG: phage head closure protein [Candidatus Peribacteraceae bacterium]|nr:phage head closure protein [Candidatus Peribacteraceae bacterium]
MAICKKKVRESKRVCIGSLNRKITIQMRDIKPPKGGSVDFTENFTVEREVWAMVESVNNTTFFDETNTEQIVSHNFYIRYIDGVEITAENWIKWRDRYYDIIGVQNLNEENRFYLLRANVRGTITKPVNEN